MCIRDRTRACVEEAYKAGAKRVQVFYQDEYINRSNYFYQSDEELQHIYPWEIDSRLDLMKDGACILHIISEIPGIMNGVDASKISKARMAKAILSKDLQEYTMLNKTCLLYTSICCIDRKKQTCIRTISVVENILQSRRKSICISVVCAKKWK